MAAGYTENPEFTEKLENYLLLSAKNTLKHDLCAAKAWLLTAKVLYPLKFGVQFLAYQIEKTTGNLKDSAKCFSELLAAFPAEQELRNEVIAMTNMLRTFEEHDVPLDTADYLVQLFYQLPESVQRGLLLNCANSTQDALDHCKLMLQLFKKFPGDIRIYAQNVIENLIAAEQQSPLRSSPVNSFRKLLVCELIPLLAQSKEYVELSPQNLLRLLDKSVEFYVTCAFDGGKRATRRDERDVVTVEDPWSRLWETILLIGAKLNWELTSCFTRYWTRESYFKALTLFQRRLVDGSHVQIAFCTLVVLLRCVHEYLPIVEPANPEHGYILVESFVQPESSQSSHSSKIQKMDDDVSVPLLTAGHGAPPQLVPAFLAGMRCLETFHLNEIVRGEYLRLREYWKADQWLHTFLMDAIIYQGLPYEQQMMMQPRRSDDSKVTALTSELSRVTWYYRVSDFRNLVHTIEKIAGLLSTIPSTSTNGSNNGNLLTATTRKLRHVHFLPIARTYILQYCVKVLLQVLKKRTSDLGLGHTLVLMQLNWPLESDSLSEISELITIRGGFGYSLFANYVINIDIIERFAYLAGPNGPKLPLDIFAGTPIHSQRRMSTRGVDKGAKEDFKLALRAQVARWNEPIDDLIISFLKNERDLIKQSLLP